MGEWNLTDELRSKVKPLVTEYINMLENEELKDYEKVSLSNTGISPIQLSELLKELGYENNSFYSNGWEYDYWWDFCNPEKKNKAKKLCIYGCAMCHDINLRSK